MSIPEERERRRSSTVSFTPDVRERRRSSAASTHSDQRERRRSSASRVSTNNSVAKKSALKKTHRRGSRPDHDEDLSDSDDGDPDNYFDENDDEDETRSVGGSILKKISSFAMLSVGSGNDDEERRKSNPNIHPKHCMCGCRAY